MPENLNQKIERVIQSPDRGLDKPQFEGKQETAPSQNGSEMREPVYVPAPTPIASNTATFLSPTEIRVKEIEKVLEEDMAEVYFSLSEVDKIKFKITGEKTAKEINSLLSEVKVKIQKIADLIRAWLKVLPGVSKFFIEQETKIKTDKLLEQYKRN